MASATVSLDARQMLNLIKQLGDRAPKAAASAINRSAISVRAAQVTAVSKDMGVKAAAVRSRIDTVKARPDINPTARFRVSLKRLSLVAFGARQLKRAGVSARVGGKRKKYPGAFIPGARTGRPSTFSKQVFRRTGKTRLPIIALRGPSVGKVFGKHWNKVARARFVEVLPKNLAAELRFRGRS